MGVVLSGQQKKRLVRQKLKEKRRESIPRTAQQTISYQTMYKDGICRVTDHFYTKTVMFGDINYQLALNEDKAAAFELWCDFYNYFDSSISLQIDQTMTMTRQAFRGTLTMENGTSTQLTDIDLAVVVTNMLGEQAVWADGA